jgi:hypothetical protein
MVVDNYVAFGLYIGTESLAEPSMRWFCALSAEGSEFRVDIRSE